jgi:PQQ-like domain
MPEARGTARRTLQARRFRRRRRVAALSVIVVLVVTAVIVASCLGGTGASTPTSTSLPAASGGTSGTSRPSGVSVTTTRSGGPSSIEAGIEAWPLAAPLSRESVVADGSGLTVLGGITAAGSSLPTVSTIAPATGAVVPTAGLADPVHDAASATIGRTTFVFGGGSPNTVATVQAVTTPALPPTAGTPGTVVGRLPQPRSDLAVATMTSGDGAHAATTAYLVGGYTGTTYLPGVLATANGTAFTTVASLPVPVRYPAVVADGGMVYAFGGQTASPGSTTTATSAIQRIDPATHRATVVGHLPQALYGAAAYLIDGTIYVAGGQSPGGPTLTQITAFVPSTSKVLAAGLLPQATAFGGYATVGSGRGAVGYLVGGEVTSQAGNDQAGVASGSLRSVISLRPSPYGGPAGSPSSGSPYSGTLLIADRGNDRLVALDAARNQVWQYPSATMPPPPGGFYFPDDAFFVRRGTGIISNQEDNHTIVQIGYPSGKILWQYGHPGAPGAGPGYLNQPDDAYLVKSGVITVADASNNRILFLSPQGQVLSQIGNGADVHNPPTSIAYPNGDTPLDNGDVLVSEINGSWIDEYTPSGKLVWSVHMPTVNYPSDPQQLGTNLYLMTDYDPPAEGRILEFTRQGRVTWSYDALSGDAALKKPSLAERLPNGLIMVNDDYRNRVVVIDPTTDSIVWQYGLTDVSGTSPGLLSIPDGFDNLLANGTTPTHPQTG